MLLVLELKNRNVELFAKVLLYSLIFRYKWLGWWQCTSNVSRNCIRTSTRVSMKGGASGGGDFAVSRLIQWIGAECVRRDSSLRAIMVIGVCSNVLWRLYVLCMYDIRHVSI